MIADLRLKGQNMAETTKETNEILAMTVASIKTLRARLNNRNR